MAQPVLIAAGVLLLGLIILFHELGHFIVAKRAGMPVREFSIGFGRPILLQVRRGETRYSLRPFPLGGFVSIAGMEPGDDDPQGFDQHPLWRRIAVIFAGPLMNLVLAALIFIAMGLVFGKVVGQTREIATVLPGKPAAQAGIKPGDTLVSVAGRKGNVERLRKVIATHAKQPLEVVVRRGDRTLHFRVTPIGQEQETFEPKQPGGKPVYQKKTVGVIGIVFANRTVPMGILESLYVGVADTVALTAGMVKVLVLTVTGQLPAQVGGPVRIAYEMSQASQLGWLSFLNLAAILSVNIGFLNLLPIPALDGSRIAFLLLEGIRRRPIDRRKEALIHLVGLAVLMALVLFVTVHDVSYLRGPR